MLEQPVADLYGRHWSVTGDGVPAADTPDEAVFLPGRNVLLLAKPLLWCHLHGVPEVATAPLGSNPFPDATPEFYDAFAAAVSRAVGGAVRVLRPYAAGAAQDRRAAPRGRAAAGADVLVHPPGGRPALRAVQQVRGAAGGVRRGGDGRPDRVRGVSECSA